MTIWATASTVANYVRVLIGLAILGAIFWYLPYLGLACAVVLAISLTVSLVRSVFLGLVERSPQRSRQWEETSTKATRIVQNVAVGATVAVWIWYPFVPIADVPLAQLTLNQIVTDIFGWFLLYIIAGAGLKTLTDD